LGYDPLELRLGLRSQCRSMRPYFAACNPAYDEVMHRHPAIDESLPGPAWLRLVYRRHEAPFVTLPGVWAVIQARNERFERELGLLVRPAAPASASAQLRLW
jgi:hypothetical protein